MMKVSPCVGGCHIRGSPLLPPGRSVPAGVGGNGALLSGPSAPGSGPFPEGVDHGETSRPPEDPPAPIRPLGPGGQVGAAGVPQGARHLGTAPAPAGDYFKVSPQCPRVGLEVDGDGPPLS